MTPETDDTGRFKIDQRAVANRAVTDSPAHLRLTSGMWNALDEARLRAPTSARWLQTDAMVIVHATLTIIVVILRHPVVVLLLAITVGVVGAIAGWW